LIEFDPEGNFLAIADTRLAGVLFTSRYDDYAFMGPVIVKEEFRGDGIGEKLMIQGMDYLKGLGVKSIELDAVFLALNLYRRLGFKDKHFSYRFKKESTGGTEKIQRLDISQTDEIIELDRKLTELNRSKHLRRFCNEFPDSIYTITEDNLLAYGMVRERNGGSYAVGPLVAENSSLAERLLLGIMAKHPQKQILIGPLEPQREFIAFLRGLGFLHNIPALRMYYGEKRNYHKHVYGIIAAEKG
jgi:ribosomal-protein-alanine N-acetyltransferase